MSPQEPTRGAGKCLPSEFKPRPAPETDPTNPYRQEAAGLWIAAELAAERHQDEPGLTDLYRHRRAL